MHSIILTAIALAGAAIASTPPGFQPSSTSDLAVAFGNLAALDGVDLPKASAQVAPTVGTTQQLVGTYCLIMVDPDIPPTNPGEPTGQLLHWMQPGLSSANTSSTVAGETVFALVNPTNTSAIASYIGPNPPARSPFTHRYIQLLVNTTGNNAAVQVLTTAGQTRRPFSAQDVVTQAGLTVLAANWFNVTNSSTPATATSTASPSGTGAAGGLFTGGAVLVGPGAVVAGLGGLAVLFL